MELSSSSHATQQPTLSPMESPKQDNVFGFGQQEKDKEKSKTNPFGIKNSKQLSKNDSSTKSTKAKKNANETTDQAMQALPHCGKRMRHDLNTAIDRIATSTPKIANQLQGSDSGLLKEFLNVFDTISTALKAIVNEPQQPLTFAPKVPHLTTTRTTHHLSLGQGNESAAPMKKSYAQAVSARSSLRKPHTREQPAPSRARSTSKTTRETAWTPVKRRIPLIGHRKDTITVCQEPMDSADSAEMIDLPQEVIQRLTRPIQEPKHHQVTVLRFPHLAPRTTISAKEWRERLTAKNIKVHSILFPTIKTIEIIANCEDRQAIINYFKALDRKEENPDPYARRDGLTTPLAEGIILKTALGRVRMLKYERSSVGVNWLEKTIVESHKHLSPESISLLQTAHEKALNDRHLKTTTTM